MYRSTIRYLIASETAPLNASVLNRPIQDVANNVDYLKTTLDAISASDNLLLSKPCSSSVLVGTPVAWNSSTALFEPALAGSKTALGICVSKSSATTADIRILGFDEIDLTSSTGSAAPAAGVYYLSQTTAGQLTATRPLTGVQQPVLFADGSGGVYILFGEYLPLAGPQGVAGATGASGATGDTGATGPQGPAALPSFTSGRWYADPINRAAQGVNYAFPANKIIAVPFAAPGGATFQDLAVKVLGAGNPGDEGKLGIYGDSGFYPGSLITAANGVFNGGSAGSKVISINSTVLAAGQLVWLVMLINSGAVGIQSRLKADCWAFKGWGDGLQDPAIGYIADHTYGSLPATFPSDAAEITDVIPTIFAKTT